MDGMYVRMREVTLDRRRGLTTTTNETKNITKTSMILGSGHNELLSRSVMMSAAGMPETVAANAAQQRAKEQKDMRITEILLENFKKASILEKENRVVSVVMGGKSKEIQALQSSRIRGWREIYPPYPYTIPSLLRGYVLVGPSPR